MTLLLLLYTGVCTIFTIYRQLTEKFHNLRNLQYLRIFKKSFLHFNGVEVMRKFSGKKL